MTIAEQLQLAAVWVSGFVTGGIVGALALGHYLLKDRNDAT